jgi:hypothetical protein
MAAPPPSKPDRRFSRIRLSSRWGLCREGAALRLVPKSGGQTFGITQANGTRLIPPPVSPRGHSRWFSFPSFCPPYFHLPASLGSTVVTRFVATMDALTPARQARGRKARRTHQHRRVSLVSSLGLPAIPSPTISVSSGDCPAVRRLGLFAYRPRYRLRHSLAGSPNHTDRIEFTVTAHTGRLCYGLVVLVPLLSTPPCGDAVTVRYNTILHRTEADFHRPIPTPSQAH